MLLSEILNCNSSQGCKLNPKGSQAAFACSYRWRYVICANNPTTAHVYMTGSHGERFYHNVKKMQMALCIKKKAYEANLLHCAIGRGTTAIHLQI